MKLSTLAISIVGLASFATSVWAVDYFSWLAVRYSNGSVKTFLQGPYKSKSWCDKLNQSTWDNTLTACGSCTVDQKFCDRLDNLPVMYGKLLRGDPATIPYVIATPEGRIFFSGVTTSTAHDECHRLAASFKANGYAAARCVLP